MVRGCPYGGAAQLGSTWALAAIAAGGLLMFSEESAA
jgi:hypothetical protein